jgi:ABC-type transport system substrate-binding protein
VSFQDGTQFDAAAVLANAVRWTAQPSLSGLPPGLLADSPRPGLVRFILPAPDPAFDRRLASSRLGIVSPRALTAAGAGSGLAPVDLATAADAGTGPFELRERDSDRLLLARNTEWWGAERGLGPGVDQLEFSVVADRGQRYDRLSSGDDQAAEALGRRLLAEARRDPLLTVVSLRGAGPLAVERSVRGIPEDVPAPPLSGVWRTGLG